MSLGGLYCNLYCSQSFGDAGETLATHLLLLRCNLYYASVSASVDQVCKRATTVPGLSEQELTREQRHNLPEATCYLPHGPAATSCNEHCHSG